jgi:hypothetical protein
MSVLFSVAGWSFFLSYKNSPFGDLLPPLSDVFWHPLNFFSSLTQVIKLEGERKSEETKERRRRHVDDITKRAAFQKAHGMETDGFGGWTAKTDEEKLGPALDMQDPKAQPALDVEVKKGSSYRWFGIW